MSLILVNAVSAKHGGAQTIVESFAFSCKEKSTDKFVFLAGFPSPTNLPANVTWKLRPKSGAVSVLYTLFGIYLLFIISRSDALVSFNNVNCVFISSRRKVTYFHQLKALDSIFTESKLLVIRSYLKFSREVIIVQSDQVRKLFYSFFGDHRRVVVAWPGVVIPSESRPVERRANKILVPISSPQSSHKNFQFVREAAALLGEKYTFLVTADSFCHTANAVENIEFIGNQSRSNLFLLYREVGCVIIASTHETVGLPIFEALSVGTPVIAFDAPYIQQYRFKFGITSGLTIVKSPELACLAVRESLVETPDIRYAQDFRLGEWNKVLDEIK